MNASMPARLRVPSMALSLAVLLLAGCAGGPVPRTDQTDQRVALNVDLAVGYMQRGQLETAQEELRQALKLQPNDSRANHVMAALQMRLNRPEEARRYFRRAVRADPENSDANHDFAIFLCARGDVEEARERYEQVLSDPLYDRPALAHTNMGQCLLQPPDPDPVKAERHFRVALERAPRLPGALSNMALLSYEKGNYLSARGYLQRYFEVGPESPDTLLLGVRVEQALGAPDVAADYAARLRTRFASSEQAEMLSEIMGDSRK